MASINTGAPNTAPPAYNNPTANSTQSRAGLVPWAIGFAFLIGILIYWMAQDRDAKGIMNNGAVQSQDASGKAIPGTSAPIRQ